MTFKNKNNYTETSKVPFLGCLIFGFLYFAYKGIWRHALISFVLAILTGGLAWLVYPFFASGIVRNNYLRNGWEEVEGNETKNYNYGGYIALVFLIIFVLYIYMNMQGVR